MLPQRLLDASGAVFWLCCMTITLHDFEHMQAFIAEHGVPVVATNVGPQLDTLQAKRANRARFLADHVFREAA
jgi:hypothetical protein